MISVKIHIVDDESSIRRGTLQNLKKDYEVKAFSTAEDALESLEGERPDILLLDIGLPGMSGMEALQEIKRLYPEILVIMVTAFEDIHTVVSAMKLGAYDYLLKPLHTETLRATIGHAVEGIRMRKEIERYQERLLKENLPCFLWESDAIQEVMEIIGKVAASPGAPVLILGESGTGKELIASAIHYRSPHFRYEFVAINCAAIPRELFESELFGYEKGAFSGAAASGKKGLVEKAAGGTLFLDEIGDLNLDAQAKLLRFIEEGEYYRVGGTEKMKSQARVVSATNKDLESMIEKKVFREDLYYRLAVIKIRLPSLNERPEDIMPIARYFLVTLSQKYGKGFTGVSPEVEDFLAHHQWKGNIRELRNLMERGVIMGDGPLLSLADLGVVTEDAWEGGDRLARFGQFPSLPPSGLDLAALEDHYIREALKKAQGNEAKAAKLLKMSYYSFRYRKNKLGHC